MAVRIAGRRARAIVAHCVLLLLAPAFAFGAPAEKGSQPGISARASEPAPIDPKTWVDHDGKPIPQPPEWEPKLWAHFFRQAVVDPLAHAFDIPDKLLMGARPFGARWPREAVNVNAYDEVPNSTWFTNRNHVRAISTARLRQGPHALGTPAKPWTIRKLKAEGYSVGFQIKDAAGKKWLVKLDPRNYPQLSSGADRIARTLLYAAGYTVPHNESVRFRREDLRIDEELLQGKDGESLSEAELDSVLTRGAVLADGNHSGYASLFVEGHVLGWPSMNQRRPGDTNDWHQHVNRRDMRGLFVISSWIGNWDTKDSNLLDAFVTTHDSLGHVEHYVLDAGASLGAAANGPKSPYSGYEHYIDFGWVARRLVTLGFMVEPWRRARQETGIPSAGNFESEVYRPEEFKPFVPHPAFRLLTDRDGYWGAKIVASFSNTQIAAVVQGAGYEDRRTTEFLTRALIERRDKVARHWFARVAPLDFFEVDGGVLCFRDLAVDLGLTGARPYDVQIATQGGRKSVRRKQRLERAELPLSELGASESLSLTFSIAGDDARPVRVDLVRRGSEWVVSGVRHA